MKPSTKLRKVGNAAGKKPVTRARTNRASGTAKDSSSRYANTRRPSGNVR